MFRIFMTTFVIGILEAKLIGKGLVDEKNDILIFTVLNFI